MILPMVFGIIVLGRSFDRHGLSSKFFYIYDQDDLAKRVQVTANPSVESKFIVPTSNAELEKFLDFDAEFALKSKHKSVTFHGYTNLVEPVIDREKTVEIVLSVKVNVESRTFPSNTTLTSDWQGRSQTIVGTHFVKSIQYGGLYLGSYRLEAAKPEYVEHIKAAVEKYFGKTVDISNILPENIEKFEDEIGGKALRSVSMYSSPPVSFFPYSSFSQLVKGAKDFPDTVRNGKASPISMELVDLHTVEDSFTEFKINSELTPLLEELNAKYDDVRLSKKLYRYWANKFIGVPKKYRPMITDYEKRLQKAHFAVSLAVARLDVTGDTNQFDDAFKTYGESKDNNKYRKELKDIMQDVKSGHLKDLKYLMTSFQNLLTEVKSL